MVTVHGKSEASHFVSGIRGQASSDQEIIEVGLMRLNGAINATSTVRCNHILLSRGFCKGKVLSFQNR
jgi:hypothetical protein